MDEQELKFTPELVDDQLDQLLAHRTPSTQNERMVAYLSQMYQDDEHSLSKVWQRLGLVEPEQPASVERQPKMLRTSFTPPPSAHARLPGSERMHPLHCAQRRPLNRAFSLLVAACAIVMLVASMFAISFLVRQNQGSQVSVPRQPLPPGIYTSDANHVVKVSAQNHRIMWQQTLKDATQILPAGNVVYVLQSCATYTCTNGVVELDANSGNVLWTYHLPVPKLDGNDGDISTTNLVLSQGRLYVGQGVAEIIRNKAPITAINQIYVLKASDGSQQAAYPNIVGESLAVDDNVLVVNARPGLQAYDATNGKPLWHVTLPGAVAGGPQIPIVPALHLSIVNKLIYAVITTSAGAINQGHDIIAAYNLSGERVWQSPTFPGGTLSTYTIDQNVIYFGMRVATKHSLSGYFYAYDLRNDHLLWGKPVDGDPQEPIGGDPQEAFVVSNGLVYIVADQSTDKHAHLMALDTTTGALKWQYTLPGSSLGSFCINNGLVYINSTNSGSANPGLPQIDALNANNGSMLWEASQPGIDMIVPIE